MRILVIREFEFSLRSHSFLEGAICPSLQLPFVVFPGSKISFLPAQLYRIHSLIQVFNAFNQIHTTVRMTGRWT